MLQVLRFNIGHKAATGSYFGNVRRDFAAGIARILGHVMNMAARGIYFQHIPLLYLIGVGTLDGQQPNIDAVAIEDTGIVLGNNVVHANSLEHERRIFTAGA